MATQLIEAYSHPFHLQDYKDDYETALRELIKAKQKKAPLPLEEKTVRRAKVINLMDALRQSVSKAKGSGAAKGSAASERRSSSATSRTPAKSGPVLVGASRRKRRAA
jgi:DNA end-binding protein Ku